MKSSETTPLFATVLVAAVGACLLAVVSTASADMVFRATGEVVHAEDNDANDGFDYSVITDVEVFLTVPTNLVLDSNYQVQGGSYTSYSGLSMTVNVYAGSALYATTNTDSPTTVLFWDRATGPRDVVEIESDDAGVGADVTLDFEARAGDAIYGGLFNRNTPAPNTMLPGFLPVFSNTTQRDAIYDMAPGLGFRGTGTNFADGMLGTNMTSFELVPEPATMSLLAIGGLALLRRRRS